MTDPMHPVWLCWLEGNEERASIRGGATAAMAAAGYASDEADLRDSAYPMTVHTENFAGHLETFVVSEDP